MDRQRFETFQVVHRQKIVDERQRRTHAAGQGLIIRRAKQRVEPDKPVTRAAEPADFIPQ